jgi:hypothetical protein
MRVPRFAKRLLVGTVSAALLTAAAPTFATHSWAGLHWARTSTLNIRLADNVSSLWDPHLVTASTDWTQSIPIDTTPIQGYRNPYYCNPTYGRVEVCSYRYGPTGWLGIAQVWTSSGHIVQAIVAVNDTYFAYAKYNTPAWRRLVMCQEIGHTLGLDHQDENKANANLGTCMDYTSDPSGTKGTNGTLSNEHPNAHDYDELRLIYSHLDGWQLSATRATAITPLGTNNIAEQVAGSRLPPSVGVPLANRPEWGRPVAADRKGRGRVFARGFPNGVVQTTFVLWADAEDR